MKERMKLRLYLVLLIVAIVAIVSTSYVILTSDIPFVPLYSIPPLLAVIFLLSHYLVKPIEDKIGRKRVTIIIFSVAIIAIILVDSAVVIGSSKWAFTITTDKPTYKLGEDVQIIVRLENRGFLTQGFDPRVCAPIIVSVEYESPYNPTVTTQVWYSPYNEDLRCHFSIRPGQHIERDFLWNQTNTANPWSWNTTYKEGTFQIWAFIPRPGPFHLRTNPLFETWTIINVTSNLHNPSLP
jgi:hypothetical protein